MKTLLKDYIGKSLVGHKVNFVCSCIVPFDITGRVVSYKIISNEIVWTVSLDGKSTSIGENTPNLFISIIE